VTPRATCTTSTMVARFTANMRICATNGHVSPSILKCIYIAGFSCSTGRCAKVQLTHPPGMMPVNAQFYEPFPFDSMLGQSKKLAKDDVSPAVVGGTQAKSLVDTVAEDIESV
jgi:hypothetical protein